MELLFPQRRWWLTLQHSHDAFAVACRAMRGTPHSCAVHACRLCAGSGLTPPTSAPGLGSHLPASAPGLGPPRQHPHRDWAHPCPHLRLDRAHPAHIQRRAAGLTPPTSRAVPPAGVHFAFPDVLPSKARTCRPLSRLFGHYELLMESPCICTYERFGVSNCEAFALSRVCFHVVAVPSFERACVRACMRVWIS